MEIQLVLLLLGTIGGFIGFYYKVNKDLNDSIKEVKKESEDKAELVRIEAEKRHEEALKELDAKRARIYERVDEIKVHHEIEIVDLRKEISEHYVPMKMCQLIHTNSDSNFKEVKDRLSNIEMQLRDLIKFNADK